MASDKNDCEPSNKSLQNELNKLKQQLKSDLELIALRNFPAKIELFRQLQKSMAKEIDTVKKNESVCTIPVPNSLRENLDKLKNKHSVQDLLGLNQNLQCFQLSRKPVLLKNCQMPTNTAIAELIEKVLTHLIELDQDLNRLDYALRLILPKMREGEYLGTEMLHEANDKVTKLQGATQYRIHLLSGYHYERYTMLYNIITYSHLEDYRLKLSRLDQKYCLELTRSINFMCMATTLVHVMVKKNADKLAEFKNMAEDNKEFDLCY